MQLNEFIALHNLNTGDRLIQGKTIVSHHGIVVIGTDGNHLIAENQPQVGVLYIPLENFIQRNSGKDIRIIKFNGAELARRNVIPRVNALIGTKYDLVNFNCEHFANYIQTGRSFSGQVAASVVLLVVGIGVYAFRRK